MKNFINGFATYFKGLVFSFSNKRIRKIIFFAAFIDVTIFIVVLFSASFRLGPFLASHLSDPHIWYQYLYYYAVYLLALIGIFFMSGLVVYFISTVFMIRVGDVLSRITLENRGVGISGSQKRSVAVVLKAISLTALTTITFFISLIPGLGIIGLLMSSVLLTFDMMDYGFDHIALSLPQRLEFFKKNMASVLGFSAGLMIVMTVPVINVLLLPGGVVASSFLLSEIVKNEA